MKSVIMAASLLAVAAAGAPQARAADLDYGRGDRYSSPYEDPRYRDLYAQPQHYTERYQYEERSYQPQPPPHYAYNESGRPGCLPRHEIRHRLRTEGWGDFHALELRPEFALVRARRVNGDLFELRVDRCSGAVVDARPIDRYIPGPYAGGPRRWYRPYF